MTPQYSMDDLRETLQHVQRGLAEAICQSADLDAPEPLPRRYMDACHAVHWIVSRLASADLSRGDLEWIAAQADEIMAIRDELKGDET
jgi:hypothetical protein